MGGGGRGGDGEGAPGRKQGHCKERTGEKEALWREEGKEGQGEWVRGIRGGSRENLGKTTVTLLSYALSTAQNPECRDRYVR